MTTTLSPVWKANFLASSWICSQEGVQISTAAEKMILSTRPNTYLGYHQDLLLRSTGLQVQDLLLKSCTSPMPCSIMSISDLDTNQIKRVTWLVSSRVGERMRANGNAFRPPLGRPGGGGDLRMEAMMGKQKAAVFPDPV